jgi:RNA polymerase sporulation-specific sigma factor
VKASTAEERIVDYDLMLDEDIVEVALSGDSRALEYLLNKYRNFVRTKARSYFLIGADREDIVQEGMIGLYKAIRDFRPNKLSTFRAFAELCITRQIITAIKTATRQKHIPLNSYISLNKPIYDEESDRTLMDVISGVRVTDPEELIIRKEELTDDLRLTMAALYLLSYMGLLDVRSWMLEVEVLVTSIF